MKKTQFRIVFLAFSLIVLLGFSSIGAAQMGTWKKLPDMPVERSTHATSVVNGKIYVIGGLHEAVSSPDNSLYHAGVSEYDPLTDTWTEKADILTPRWGLFACAVNGFIYAIGGATEFGSNIVAERFVERYDPVSDEWTVRTPMPTARLKAGASVVNGKIYVIGGAVKDGEDWAVTASVEEYDPEIDTWTKKADMPTARGYFRAATVNGKIYAIGGREAGGYFTMFAAVEEYDPMTNTWKKLPDMLPGANAFFGISVVNERIYIVGGRGEANRLSEAYEYNPVRDTWKKLPDMPTTRTELACSAVNSRVYAIGGYIGTRLPDVEVYDTGLGMQVTDISPQKGPVVGGDSISIFGSDFLPEVEVTIGGKPLIQLEVTDLLITGIIPPGMEGEQDIRITVSDFNYSSTIGSFIYTTPFSVFVTRITPTNGKQAGGDLGSISGSGFLPGAMLTIGGNQATDVGVTPTLINFRIPPGTAGAKDVVVTNPNGHKDMLRDAYTYNPFPVIEKLSPRYGGPLAGGTEIIITGSHFMAGVEVAIGENRAQKPDFFSPTELRLKTPPDEAGMKAVKVINPDRQEAIMEEGFTYNPAPTITNVEPDAGSLEGGTFITITGTGFIYPDVLIGGVEASTQRRLSTKITALTPPSDAGVKDVVVVNRDGQKATLKDAFTYNPAPVITGITPDNGRLAGGTEITIRGSGFLTGAKALFSTDTGVFLVASSTQVLSSNLITAITPPGKPGTDDVKVTNTDKQYAILEEAFTYNAMPTITSITPNYGSSAGGTKIIIEGTGFLQSGIVMIGELPATTQVKGDTTIEATSPSLPQGVWDVRVVNPDTQEVVMSKGFISVGEVAYNYPNPFRASQGTTFRYVTGDPVQSITVKIFNLAGVPIDVVQQTDSNEVKWHNAEVHAGLYVYLMEIELESGKMKQFRSVLEVRK